MKKKITGKIKSFKWIFLGTLIFIVSMFIVYKSLMPTNPNIKKVMADGKITLHAKGRTLLILIDSLRTDFCFNAERMPFMNSLKKKVLGEYLKYYRIP